MGYNLIFKNEDPFQKGIYVFRVEEEERLQKNHYNGIEAMIFVNQLCLFLLMNRVWVHSLIAQKINNDGNTKQVHRD